MVASRLFRRDGNLAVFSNPELSSPKRVDACPHKAKPKGLPMTRETAVRTQIAVLIYSMTNGVMFGAGLIVVLMVPALNEFAGFWIAVVVAASLVLAAPFAWLMAPRLRARYWRRRLLAAPSSLASAPTRPF
jgi:hypothetical protein